MATARFQLKSKKDKTSITPVYLVVEHQSKEILKYPTDVKVTPKQWHSEKKEVRRYGDVPYERYNQTLSELMGKVNDIFVELNVKDIPITGETMRNELNIATGKDVKKNFERDFLGFILSENEKVKGKVNTTTGQKFSRGTISKYNCFCRAVAEMAKKERKTLTFDCINMDFYYKFVLLLQDKGFMPNTIGSKYIRPLKSMLLEAERQGIKVNNAYKYREFKELSDEPFKISLNETEIKRIETFDLSKSERLERVRDVFMLGYYTGQRWGDYSVFSKNQFEGNNIKLMQRKGAKQVVIPVGQNVFAIMEKYKWQLPKISQQKFNEYLKEVCQAVGLCDVISRTHLLGSQRQTVQYQKWELITSHTARRSFATNMYVSRKLQPLHIMQITGHSTEKDFKKYIIVSSEENAEIVRDAMNGIKQPSLLMKVA